MSSPETPGADFDAIIAGQGFSYEYTDEDRQLIQLNRAYDQFHARAHQQPGRETCTDGERISLRNFRGLERRLLSVSIERVSSGIMKLILMHVDERGEYTENGHVYDPLVAPGKQARDIAAITKTLDDMSDDVVYPDRRVNVINRTFHEEL